MGKLLISRLSLNSFDFALPYDIYRYNTYLKTLSLICIIYLEKNNACTKVI